MKILYVSSAAQPDYLCDMVFHGLRSLFGPDVVDVNRLGYMYKGAKTTNLYGRGFTLYGLLDEGTVDRTDIPARIRSVSFDYVIFGSIQREYSLLGQVRESYPASNILMIDGEDSPHYIGDCVNYGLYFKRELYTPNHKVFPIQFAIPEEKIGCALPKSFLMAPLDPMDTRTYIYHDEKSYYDSYREALFGKTMKKAGWDCLRHYEIMAAGCIPYFMNLEYCPETIMTRLPKKTLLTAKTLFDYKQGSLFQSSCGRELWADLNEDIQDEFRKNLTTIALAKYVLDQAGKA